MTIPALVDQDIQPMDHFEDCIDDEFELTIGVDEDEDAIIDALQGKQVLFCTSRLEVTRDVLEAAPDLELVAKIGTGIDSIDLDAARELGVTAVHTPGLNAMSVAEYAVTLLLTLSRKTLQSHRALGEGQWRDEIALGDPVVGRTVGIVGFGNVGSRVAGLLSGFNADVLAYDPYVHEIDTETTGVELVEFETLLTEADAVIVAAELTEETRGMVDADAFGLMDDGVTFVNVARGPVIDQEALVDALRNDRIEGAGLDVFETEPLPTSSPLHEFDNVIVTPHIAGTAAGTRERIIAEITNLAWKFCENEPIHDRFVAADSR